MYPPAPMVAPTAFGRPPPPNQPRENTSIDLFAQWKSTTTIYNGQIRDSATTWTELHNMIYAVE